VIDHVLLQSNKSYFVQLEAVAAPGMIVAIEVLLPGANGRAKGLSITGPYHRLLVFNDFK